MGSANAPGLTATGQSVAQDPVILDRSAPKYARVVHGRAPSGCSLSTAATDDDAREEVGAAVA